LAANKNIEYRKSVTLLFRALARFLDEQGFAKHALEIQIDEDPWQFKLHEEDLTAEGLDWMMNELHPWMTRMDRRRKRKEMEDLLTALRKTIETN